MAIGFLPDFSLIPTQVIHDLDEEFGFFGADESTWEREKQVHLGRGRQRHSGAVQHIPYGESLMKSLYG